MQYFQMNTYWTEAAQLYLILRQSFFRKISASQIWSSGSFEECLYMKHTWFGSGGQGLYNIFTNPEMILGSILAVMIY